jgi:hypothetical protein
MGVITKYLSSVLIYIIAAILFIEVIKEAGYNIQT